MARLAPGKSACSALGLKREPSLAEQFKTGIGDRGIIGATAAALDLLEGELYAQGRTVRPVRGHRFHHVRHGHDARLEQDLPVLQSLRVPRAVQLLVMLADDVGDGPGKIHVLQDFIAGLRVRLYEHELDVAELPGFGAISGDGSNWPN